MSDETLEREIEAALGADPSPEFLPRIRARVAREHENEGWLFSGVWRWAGAGLAVAAIAILAIWVSSDSGPAPREVQIANTPRLEPSAPAPGVVTSSPDEAAAPVAVPVVRSVRTRPRPVQMRTEVVISQDEAAALRQLVAAIAARQVEAVDIPKLEGESAPLAPIEEIVLEPIELSPIAGLEGE